jgi:integrase
MNDLPVPVQTLPAETVRAVSKWAALAGRALSANTLKAYRADWDGFTQWCAGKGYPWLPASHETVIEYLQSGTEASLATLKRRLASIAALHRAGGHPSPTRHDHVRLALKGMKKSTAQKQAAGLTVGHTHQVKAALGDDIKDARDYALVIVGRELLARSAELVALKVEDVKFQPDGWALVNLLRQKTSTEADVMAMRPHAVEALSRWLTLSGIKQGPLFQSLNRCRAATGRPLDTRDVRRIVKDLARRAGLDDAESVSAHSMRVGMAQDLSEANFELPAIMQSGGWKSSAMVSRYTRHLDARRSAVARFDKS